MKIALLWAVLFATLSAFAQADTAIRKNSIWEDTNPPKLFGYQTEPSLAGGSRNKGAIMKIDDTRLIADYIKETPPKKKTVSRIQALENKVAELENKINLMNEASLNEAMGNLYTLQGNIELKRKVDSMADAMQYFFSVKQTFSLPNSMVTRTDSLPTPWEGTDMGTGLAGDTKMLYFSTDAAVKGFIIWAPAGKTSQVYDMNDIPAALQKKLRKYLRTAQTVAIP